jgi:hypothetical protein
MSETALRLKIIADSEFADALKAEAVARPADLVIESERNEKDATKLGFDLADAVSIVAIVKGAIDAATFAAKIYGWWHDSKKKKPRYKVILQTPLRTLELHSNIPVTQAEIQRFLEASAIKTK